MPEETKHYLEEAELSLKELYAIILKRKKIFLRTALAVFLGVVIFTYLQTPLFKATALLMIEKPEESNLTQRRVVSIPDFDNSYYNTQYEILKSRTLLERAAKELSLDKLPDFAKSDDIVESFSKIIEVKPLRRTRLVKLSVYYKDPAIAVAMTNILADLYIKQNVENLLYMSKEILKAFPKAVKEITQDTLYERLDELSKDELVSSLPSIIENPTVKQLKSEKVIIESEMADLSRRYKEKHPTMIALKNKLKFIDSQLSVETEKVLSGLRADLAGKFKANNIRIIDYAEMPNKPARPNKPLNIALGFIFSVFLGVSLIFFLEYIENKIHTKKDIERHLGLPVLGEILLLKDVPKSGFKIDNILSLFKDNHQFREVVEMLKTNMIFSLTEEESKAMLISSSIPGEGKTFISAIIAISFARDGKKTLLLDTDMRKPGVNKIFNIDSEPGFSDIIMGGSGIDEYIKKTPIDDLYILPAGGYVQDSPRLLNSERAKNVIEDLKKRFDRIVMDTPPMLMFADSAIISRLCSTMLLVVRSDYVDKDAVKNLVIDLKKKNAKIVGAVLNCLDISRHTQTGYYYYHKAYKDYYKREETTVLLKEE